MCFFFGGGRDIFLFLSLFCFSLLSRSVRADFSSPPSLSLSRFFLFFLSLPHVRRLDLSGNGLSSTHVNLLTTFLTSARCRLTHLNLAYNSFDPSEKRIESLMTETGAFSFVLFFLVPPSFPVRVSIL